MKAQIIKSSELGTNCWSPKRFAHNCASCQRYDRCKYPEKRVNKKYEGLRQLRKVKLTEVKEIEQEMRDIVGEHGDNRRTVIEESGDGKEKE